MKPKAITMIFLGAVIAVMPADAVAAEFPYPTVEFSADMTMKIQSENGTQSHTVSGTVNATRNSERREIENFGHKTIVIKRRDKNETWLIMPAMKTYRVTKGEQQRNDPERMIREGELKLTKQGSETVNGVSTTKYRIASSNKKNGQFDGFAWLTKQNIPVRLEGKARDATNIMNVRIDYNSIRIGHQEPKLFEIPPGFRQMPNNGSMGMPPQSGQAPQGMDQEALERYRRQMEEILKQRPKQ